MMRKLGRWERDEAWQGKWKVHGRRGRVDGAGGQRKMVNCKNQGERKG